MLELFNSIRAGLFIVGDIALFLLVLYLVSETISEIREGDRIEEELKTVLKNREAFYND